jgi:uncharacterized protein with GYD domain
MPTYIQLMTLTPEGRAKTLEDPTSVLRAHESIRMPGVQELGLYGVLGNYDFVHIVEADDNDVIARFSLELGVRAGAHVITLPAIPIGRLEAKDPDRPRAEATGALLPTEQPDES